MADTKTQVDRWRQRWGALSGAQKLLAAGLAAAAVMTVVWWLRGAAAPEMEPVLDQDLSMDDLARMKAAVAGRGITYEVNGNRLLVPADRKFEVLADLGYAQLLPADTHAGWEDIMEKMDSPWNGPEKDQAMWNTIKEMTLAQVIRGFPRVRNAVVVLDTTSSRHIGSPDVEASASVNIVMQSGQRADKKLVDAAADVVAGATSNLQRGRVKVIIDGVSYTVHDADNELGANDGWIDRVKEIEGFYAGEIERNLSFIDGVLVSVAVQTKDDSEQTQETRYDKDNVVHRETEVEMVREGGLVPQRPGGAAAATGEPQMMSVGEGDPAVREATTTRYENEVPVKVATTRSPAGSATVTAVSVQVPRSYFVRVWKAQQGQGEGAAPTEEQLSPVRRQAMAVIRASVKGCTALKSDDAIIVAEYPDLPAPMTAMAQVPQAPVSLLAGGYSKEIALAALLAGSLLMVSIMARRAAPAGPAPAEQAPASAGSDEAESRRGRDVAAMVREDPDAAAEVVKRWLKRA